MLYAVQRSLILLNIHIYNIFGNNIAIFKTLVSFLIYILHFTESKSRCMVPWFGGVMFLFIVDEPL